MDTRAFDRRIAVSGQAGYSLVELMIAVAIMLIVSGTVLDGVFRLTRVSDTISNRTEMHSGVRNATELLQQEVGQAGRISLPAPVILDGAVAAGATQAVVSSVDDMFVGEQLVVSTGDTEETVTVTAIAPLTRTLTFAKAFGNAHNDDTPVQVHGGFAAGIVPTTAANGSTASRLKIFGDINGNGRMVYVEYHCDTAAGNLYRNSMPFDAAVKPAVTVEQVLLNNIQPNPDGTPCFTYQEEVVTGTTYVIGVAITLTVRTQDRDPTTGAFQTETKALLNVSPRNVFHVWQLATLQIGNRIQQTPATVTALLAD